MSEVFPQVERLADGRTQYRWTSKLACPVTGSLSDLSVRVRSTAMARYRQTLRDQGFATDAEAELHLEVGVAEVGSDVYQVEVSSTVRFHRGALFRGA